MKDKLVVILVEPEYGLNIGYVARTMKNFGINKLYITGRREIPKSAFRFSSHARDILEKAILVDNFQDLMGEFDFIIGTTARIATRSANIIRKAIIPEEAVKFIHKFNKIALVLGRDTIGLKNEELALCDIVVTIPTGTSYTTLNISHALAILLYTFTKRMTGKRDMVPSKKERNQLITYVNSLMEEIGFPKYRRLRVIKTFNKIAISTELRKEDMTTILGFFRRVLINLKRKGNH